MLLGARPGLSRIALSLSFIATLLAALWVGTFLIGLVAQLQHVPLDHDEGLHATPSLQVAAEITERDPAGLVRSTVAQSFYPFGYSWIAAPVVLAFGPTALALRTFNVILLLLAVGLGWAIAADLAPGQRWLAGLVTAVLMLTSAPLLVNSAHIYVDTAGLFFSLLTVFLYTRTLCPPQASRFTVHVSGFALHAPRSALPVLVGALIGWTFLIKYPFGPLLIGGIAVSEFLRNRAAGRWLPTTAQWLLGGTAAGVFVVWIALPGVVAGMREYAGAHPPDAPLLSLQNWLYYPRAMITVYPVAPIVGWLVMLGTVYALVDRRDERLRAWAIYLWVGTAILILRRALEPRFAMTVLPTAFVVAGPLAARTLGGVIKALGRREPGAKAERRFALSFGTLLQVDFELTVRRLWAESALGRGAAIAALALILAGLVYEANLAWTRRLATLPILLPLTYRTDALAIVSPQESWRLGASEGTPALYDFISAQIADPAPRVALFYGWLELSAPALNWELARRAWPAGRPQDVNVRGYYHTQVSPENVRAVRESVAAYRPDYIVVYSDARYGGPHWEWNQFALDMRDDLQLIGSGIYTPTVIEDSDLTGWLFENRPMTADEIRGRLRGFSKPWPHFVDVFRYKPGAFAADPLPDLTGLLDTPASGRSFIVPPMQTPVGAGFGRDVRLLGFDLNRQRTTATFTFYWQSQRWMREPYHVFVHVLNPSGSDLIAGQDIEPRDNGSYPMTWWAPGEVVTDTVTVDLAGVPPGEYRVGTGIYDLNSGARLPAYPAGGEAIGDGWLPLIENFRVP